MNINLRFFASVREAVGTAGETVSLPEGVTTVGAVRGFLIARGGAWAEALGRERALRMAFNHVMCEPETAIREGGEVAFFPPVTGG
ncbi:molybdenum cofactor biosynthesis protein MoaD [Massilia sp. WF1]|uniref:molybdopterin converting factor subunit 1 n=1 Tax=unclassified Massilia TaxID=2609279 RepID=UPI000649BFA4|nr:MULTISPECIES: molybdopterin converting factor subunit 1 [unclassified Massilia]ALK97238.1 molybdopterin synthase sulfur carrier subunit [Massilia sp. WG5]KLU36420.1 molybdenum cofactor biosynthesis protein MoaD [Massilia sp. WF1]